MGGDDEDEDDYDYGYGVEMTSKHCFILFNLPAEGRGGPNNKAVTIAVYRYKVATGECWWGGLNVCVLLVPAMSHPSFFSLG